MGEAKGKMDGKAEGVRNSIRGFLAVRLPVLAATPEIDAIPDIDALNRLSLSIFAADTEDAVREALRSAIGAAPSPAS